jgi:four helix bundle protein
MSDANDSGRSFRGLRVWQEAKGLARDVYLLVGGIPGAHASLADQIRRAAVSVPANIAEGTSRPSRREFARFLHIARGSLTELESHLDIASAVGVVRPEAARSLQARIRRVSQLLAGLLHALAPPPS